METLLLEEILEAIKGKIYLKGNKTTFNSICTDTRKIEQDNMFIALKGENFDGNEYVKLASQKGATICVIDKVKFENKDITESTTVIIVEDTKRALLDLAMYYRKKLKIKVIGVTGSTGKTSTKDLIAAALSEKYKVFKTKGNFNNEIGLPLMMFQIDNSYDIAILEMGMSNLKEIHNLSEVAKPDIAVITNIGISHIENLKSRENILQAKMEITDFFQKGNTLIVNAENDLLQRVESDKYKVIKVGESTQLDLIAQEIYLAENSISFKTISKKSGEIGYFKVNVPGKHNVLNTLLAIGCAVTLGVSSDEISKGLLNLQTTSMRLDINKGDKFTIVDDCYNASPDSMIAAIDVLENIQGNRKIAILGTMMELGHESYAAHKEVGSYASNKKVDILITVGEYNNAYREGYNNDSNCISCESVEHAIEYINESINLGDVVLVKASRSMKFETIVKKLKNINC